MKRLGRRKKLIIALGFYLILWALTSVVGLPQVDQAFDRQFAMGSVGFADGGANEVPVRRIEVFDMRNPEASANQLPDWPWRCRSTGVAIAPFVILDEAAWQVHALSGFGGRRLVFWAFGFVRWVPLRRCWVS